MTVNDHGIWVSSAIVVVLLLASSITALLKHFVACDSPHEAIDNLWIRVRSWWIMAAVLGAALWAGFWATVVCFSILGVIALREYLASAPPRARHRVAGFVICVVCIAFIPALLLLTIPGYSGRNVFLIVFLILVAQASDVLQYVWGKLTGKHLIAPAISPAKTVEGFIGGVASATVIGTGLWWITPFSPWQACGVSLLITLTGFTGGLLLSAQKRARGIKDWGALIQGHGGVLDRLDSLWLSAPLYYAILKCYWAS